MARVRLAPPAAGRPAVEVVPLRAVPVVTIDQDNPCWTDPERTHEHNPLVDGAIVRIRPPSVTDAVLEHVVSEVRSIARAYTVEPRPWVAVVPASVHDGPLDGPLLVAAAGARSVVMRLVDEARTDDRGALRSLCDELLSAVGL